MRGLFVLTLLAGTLVAPLAGAQDLGPGIEFGPGPRSEGVAAKAPPARPAVTRGARYMGFAERFNRYYTDSAWRPLKTVYVSPNGNGSGATRGTPAAARAAIAVARPGSLIYFLRGRYPACHEFSKPNSGTYANPVVLFGERNSNQSLGVSLNCCTTGRASCFNFEAANYIAVDGFELIGGNYGVRAVGADYAASQHSRGIAVMNSNGHDQDRDPFFTGQSDWAVFERNAAHGAKDGDGHGIYLSNGSDWNIVRYNETYANTSSDFQINADPASTCADAGIPFSDPRCDAYAGTGEGGRGASDYFLVDSNYFHHSEVGPNFTSVRRSTIRNNIFGFQTRHNVSFWQETDNPRLGSSDNKIVHNLFITTERHGVQFSNTSTRNEFANNVLLGVRISGGKAAANPSALLMEVDNTAGGNVYRSNLYVSGRIEGRRPNAEEIVRAGFSPLWYTRFPVALNHNPNDFRPTAGAPFLAKGVLSPYARRDRNNVVRSGKVDLGPIEVP